MLFLSSLRKHAMELNKLKSRLTMPIESFSALGDTIHTPDGPLTYIDRGGSVLLVAHLDFVLWQSPSYKLGIVQCGQLDDRLGAWIALDVLPRCGIVADVLLTDSEEIGKSTAQYFDAPKEYHWIAQFDRAGTDCVTYQYQNPDWLDCIAEHWTIGHGSFSDISYLDHLSISAMNIGCGYHRQHTPQCYADLRQTEKAVQKFAAFYKQHQHTRFEHCPGTEDKESDNWEAYRDDWLYTIDCPCGEVYNCISHPYCPSCGRDALQAEY